MAGAFQIGSHVVHPEHGGYVVRGVMAPFGSPDESTLCLWLSPFHSADRDRWMMVFHNPSSNAWWGEVFGDKWLTLTGFCGAGVIQAANHGYDRNELNRQRARHIMPDERD